jgi:hypothetical protein
MQANIFKPIGINKPDTWRPEKHMRHHCPKDNLYKRMWYCPRPDKEQRQQISNPRWSCRVSSLFTAQDNLATKEPGM